MLTKFIYPLTLRERITWKIQSFFPNINDKDVGLCFDKKLRLDLSKHDVGHKSIIFNGYYELDLTKNIIGLAKKGGVLIDVGANYGYFSCLWASQNEKNKVHAFEASPRNIKALNNNIEKNRLKNQVDINPVALGKEIGMLNFDMVLEDQQTGWGGFSTQINANSIEVQVNTLDSYATDMNLVKIDVLKIDTEGADTWVLYGAKNLLKQKKIKHIFFENNPTRMKLLEIKEDDATLFLENLNYIVEKNSSNDFYAYPK